MEIKVDSLDFYRLSVVDETGQRVDFDLQQELSINEYNYEMEMLSQPAKYVYWSSLLEKLRLYEEQAELELETLIGELDQQARAEIEKPTKDSVDAYMKRTEAYKLAKEKINYYKYVVKRVQFVVKSLEQRKDMLQSYGKHRIHEAQYGSGAGNHPSQFPN